MCYIMVNSLLFLFRNINLRIHNIYMNNYDVNRIYHSYQEFILVKFEFSDSSAISV